MKALTIIGAGGHGKVVAETAEAVGYTDIAFVDQAWPERQTNGHWRIVGDSPPHNGDAQSFCAIGANSVRVQIFERFSLWDSPALCHPFAFVSPTARIGAGSFTAAGTVVNADAKVGRGVILNTNCTVEHDCVLDDFVHMSPGSHLAGGVVIGARSWIGIGAVVREGVRIGSDVVVAINFAAVPEVAEAPMMQALRSDGWARPAVPGRGLRNR